MDVTTAEVVERPTSSAPAPVEKPSWQPTAVITRENSALFTRPVKISRRNRASRVAWRYDVNVKLAPATPKRHPPITPMKSAQIVRHGTITSIARNFGATRKATGRRAMVFSASTSSVTFMVPISAANAEPDRPITMMAVISGPNSRTIEMATASATN